VDTDVEQFRTMKLHCVLLSIAAFCLSLTGCMSPSAQKARSPTQTTTIQGHHEGGFAVRVTKQGGKNVLTVIRGNPNKMSLAVAQAFIDDTVELKEGEQRDIDLDTYRPD
jgi:hypothetical protein